MSKIAIVSAMVEEIQPIITNHECELIDVINDQKVYKFKGENNEFYLLNTGVGKVNATLTTSMLINLFDIDLIVNIGTSGGLNDDLEIGDSVISNEITFHDVDVTDFGYELGQIPGSEPTLKIKENLILDEIVKELFENTYKGLVITGDQFINNSEVKDRLKNDFKDVYCVEMESAAITYTAQKLNTDIYVVRTISDLAHKESNVSFNDYLDSVSIKFMNMVELIDERL